jgi:ABC-type multidrug transport system ATPase subunit
VNKLEVDSVILEFGSRSILSDIYMCFETGQVTGILGRNGAGKSCLLRIIFGTLTPQYSNVRINGQTVFDAFKHSEMIKFLPQKSFIPKYLSLQKVLNIFNCDPQLFLNDFPEFSDYLYAPFRKFSFGQKRLIETYLILKSDSEFIMLDEPLSYLMPLYVEKLKEIIAIEKKRKGIIITDHLFNDILNIADTLYMIDDGRSIPVTNADHLRSFGWKPRVY